VVMTPEERKAARKAADAARWAALTPEQRRVIYDRHNARKTPEIRAELSKRESARRKKKWDEAPEAWRARYRRYAKKKYERDPRLCKRRTVLSQYGLTIEQFEAMVVAQNNRCAICGGPPTSPRKNAEPILCVEHKHGTKLVRSLACSECNFAFGHLDEKIWRIEKLIEYAIWIRTCPQEVRYSCTAAKKKWKEQKLVEQNGLCKACGQPPKTVIGVSGIPVLATDHSHETGYCRALLCRGCNSALGHLHESAERLQMLLAYARRWSPGTETPGS